MHVVLIVLATALSLWHAYDLYRKALVTSFLFGLLAVYGALYLLSYPQLTQHYESTILDVSTYVYFFGSLTLNLSILLLFRLAAPRLRYARQVWSWRFEHCLDDHLRPAAMALVASLALFLLYRNDLSLTGMQSRGEDGLFITLATFLCFLAFPGLVTAFSKSKLAFLAYAACVLFVFSLSGSRAAVLTTIAFWLWRRNVTGERRRWKVGPVVLLLSLALVIHFLLRLLRGISPAVVLQALLAGDFSIFSDKLFVPFDEVDPTGGESSIPSYFVFSVEVAGGEAYGFLTSAARVLLLFVPGSLAPFPKPEDVTYSLWVEALARGRFDASAYYAAINEAFVKGAYGSLHPMLYGELFLSGRWLGLLVGLMFVSMICLLIEISLISMNHRASLYLIAPTAVGMLMVARGNSAIGFGYFFYLCVLVLVIDFLQAAVRRIVVAKRGGESRV
ncbi:hypothetical protein GCM10023165_53850 [Variovorax defluvii]|uniref:Oligosaccharide repeat unit polymerase n=1 Tax=Variovorax defluvii TaxID=913761 RepID=A0ABP8IH01_9BURK